MSWLTLVSALVLLAYPLAVYFGLQHFDIGIIAALMAGIFLLRIVAAKQAKLAELRTLAWISGGAGLLLAGLGYLFQKQAWLTFYPVVVNLLMLALFATSLWQKQTIIERLARLQEPDLPPSGVRYTRKVTLLWCGFFAVNGSIALATCFMPLHIWTLYNGLLSYLLAGTLFICELLVRQWAKKTQ
ncbi:septation protein IspZ [Shewanella sp. GXUN23E]|uniref:septation protein IspZ n=1 Tax=Shewanella sp. GXUN23E TaxID=3422498 RepID=UPI003D7E3F14